MERNLFRLILLTMIAAIALVANGGVFAKEPEKSPPEEGKSPEAEYKVNLNQIAFIVKYDKDGNGKVDNKEFTGVHFPVMDKNSNGFIEPHEAPEGETAY